MYFGNSYVDAAVGYNNDKLDIIINNYIMKTN